MPNVLHLKLFPNLHRFLQQYQFYLGWKYLVFPKAVEWRPPKSGVPKYSLIFVEVESTVVALNHRRKIELYR
uniref:NADH dehydrogenase subunit 11 n=1 Tax=Heterosigma akashiwo TaxID=2829 RepID=A0A2Z6FJY0_HETAK|nr:NADH dehydrogenase subunit 11 [Heterosigma akashiwo]BBE28131.1 NADH dehydrogenase subunit 11 [Heterosigma akashiwo]BBE28170.1 NADH dehydrogenase subunit 11 [Heterosigma akashiwo]